MQSNHFILAVCPSVRGVCGGGVGWEERKERKRENERNKKYIEKKEKNLEEILVTIQLIKLIFLMKI